MPRLRRGWAASVTRRRGGPGDGGPLGAGRLPGRDIVHTREISERVLEADSGSESTRRRPSGNDFAVDRTGHRFRETLVYRRFEPAGLAPPQLFTASQGVWRGVGLLDRETAMPSSEGRFVGQCAFHARRRLVDDSSALDFKANGSKDCFPVSLERPSSNLVQNNWMM